jgi:CMP-N-acetylneuraminic acid synthetase
MNVLAVILARAGSQGLPNKHLLPLLGKPVIQYTFDHARSARLLSRVVVSSDSPDVLRLGAAAGFETIVRPAGLATADASVQDVMLHALDQVEARPGFRADALVVLYGNVPVRPPCAIDNALKLLRQTRCDSVRSFCPVGKWHPAWMSRLEGDKVVPLQPNSVHRRQDLPPLLLHDGAVVAVSRDSMLKARDNPNDPHAFFGADRRGFPTEVGQTVEIDHQRDLYWAQAVLRAAAPDLLRMAS